MLTNDDLKMIRETMEDVIENSPRIDRIEDRLTSLEEFSRKTDERLASLEEFCIIAEKRFASLEEFSRKTDERLASLEEFSRKTDERLASLEEFSRKTDERLTSLEDNFNRFCVTIENEALPLLREVAAAYSGSDVIFQKRAESLDNMSREMDIHSQMIKSHEVRLQALEIGKSNKKLAKSQG